MSRGRITVALAAFALAVGLRIWSVADVGIPTGDEGFMVPDARTYVATGQRGDTTWSYPPLHLLMLDVSMRLFGDSPWGWRLRNVALGSLTAALMALLGGGLFLDGARTGAISAALLAADPLHILISRSTFEEVPASFFFLLSVWLSLQHLKRRAGWALLLAGGALGASLATKPYYSIAGVALAGLVLAEEWREGARPRDLVHVGACFTLIPLAILVAAYLPWFARGYRLDEWVEHLRDASRALLGMTEETFANGQVLAAGGRAAGWFVWPGMFGFSMPAPDGWVRQVVLAKNMPAWLPVLPAIALAGGRAIRCRDRGDRWVVLLFAATYAPLLLATRPVFIYSALAVLPLGLLAVARMLDLMFQRRPRLGAALLAVALAGGGYLYPLATARPVPPALYAPLLDRITLFGR